MVANVVATKLATMAADCGVFVAVAVAVAMVADGGSCQCSGCERRARDAFLHDAGDLRFALHLRSALPRPDLDGWRLAALASDGGG
uniref:Uncharacterized protein n=1 Tax=Oryza sativa subsp. japonica TaxID=39947 RepID=Q2QP18_ORYSJ|nr:hypothetical protein LOC_Os12g35990 [Oryza sativa Japonica Group]